MQKNVANSQIQSNRIIQALINKTAQHIQQKTLKSATPIHYQKENNKLFEIIRKIENFQQQQNTGTQQILQNQHIQIDNFATNNLNIKKINREQPKKATSRNRLKKKTSAFSNSIYRQTSQSQQKLKSTFQSDQKFATKNKFTELQINKKAPTLSFSIDLLRIRMQNIQEQKIKQEQYEKFEQKRKKQRKRIMEAKAHNLKRYTYDYEGSFFSQKQAKPALEVPELKSQIIKKKQLSQKQLDKYLKVKKPQITQITNRRIRSREKTLGSSNLAIEKLQQIYSSQNDREKDFNSNLKLQSNVKLFSQPDSNIRQSRVESVLTTPRSQSNINNKKRSEFKKQCLTFHKFYHKQNPKLRQKRLATENPQIKNLQVQSLSSIKLHTQSNNLTPVQNINKKIMFSPRSIFPKSGRNARFLTKESSSEFINYFSSQKKIGNKSNGKIRVNNQKLFEEAIS